MYTQYKFILPNPGNFQLSKATISTTPNPTSLKLIIQSQNQVKKERIEKKNENWTTQSFFSFVLYFLAKRETGESRGYLPRDVSRAGLTGQDRSRPIHGDERVKDDREDRYDGPDNRGCGEKSDRILHRGRSG